MDEFEEFKEMNMEEFEGMDDLDLLDEVDSDMLTTLVDISATTALKLTELVVDNNHRNNQKMSAQDIYQIHADSFSAAFASVAQAHGQE